jgi:hypothetical protein
MHRLRGFVLIAAFASLIGAYQLAPAAKASPVLEDDKPDPTGTWKWTVMMGNNNREATLKLKLDGDKLTGAMVGRNNNETKIDDGATFKDGEVSFSVTRDRNGTKTVTKYTGKLSGDTIKGKISVEGRDDRDWEAKRSKD